ncbi:MAG: hypothetical protein RLZZ136_1107 [Pseudomonadota bacterium]|jgi:uncharacterized iron-regulated membrane protein
MAKANTSFYRTIWRWHFYAALFVIPMILILATTGTTYLFKPQIDRWEERSWRGLPVAGAVTPDDQVAAALAAFPGAKFNSYRLPAAEGDAALVHIALKDQAMRDVFVSPQGVVLGALNPKTRIMQVAHDIHGQLLIGKQGSWLVELAASWAIVMIITGLYLWWPRGRGAAGVLWPRLSGGNRLVWRDLHAVTGFWVSGLAMVLLLTGLPWADVWGSAFKAVRAEMGWVKGQQDWTIGGRLPTPDADEHAEHNHATMQGSVSMAGMSGHDHGMTHVALDTIVARARSEHLAFPVLVTPPGGKGGFGAKRVMAWTVRSDTQNRPERVTITYDAMTGKEQSRETFADKHVIDRVVGYGVAWHEGALFGAVNQVIGVLTGLALIVLAVSGFVLWRKRKPEGRLGAPPLPDRRVASLGLKVVIAALFVFLPLFAVSLVALWLFDRFALPHLPRLAQWLGLEV